MKITKLENMQDFYNLGKGMRCLIDTSDTLPHIRTVSSISPYTDDSKGIEGLYISFQESSSRDFVVCNEKSENTEDSLRFISMSGLSEIYLIEKDFFKE